LKSIFIIAIVAVVLLIPISNISAFEPELYEDFFITYGNCEITIDADNERMRIMFSKQMKILTQDSFCELLENSKFVYDYTISGEVVTKKIKFGEETVIRFFTTGSPGGVPVVLGENWMGGSTMKYTGGGQTELQYAGLAEKKINGKTIQVHEFVGDTYYENGESVGEVITNIQYDSKTGFLVSSKIDIAFGAVSWGGGRATLDFEANDISQKIICGKGTVEKNGQCAVDTSNQKSSKGGGCLIATATYGSEMANEVQQLRELRDNQLLNTESGTAFMGTFNDIYYSFSPTIADMERENPYFKEAVKLAITPMISSLSLMENANSESEVLSIGISVIMLNLGMYLGVPAIVIVGIRRKF
jgi:hypothetical protein